MYKRDKRSPVPKSETVSKVMSANKAKNTKPEFRVRKALWAKGIRGYRLHHKGAPGRPDIAFIKKKVAIFINGCYWHRCPDCNLNTPKSNSIFWESKFKKNIQRDKLKSKELKALGWEVLIIWECKIKENLNKEIDKIVKLYHG